MPIVDRTKLNDPSSLSPIHKDYLEREAMQVAQRIASGYPNQAVFIGMVALNLQTIAAQMMPASKPKAPSNDETLFGE